MLDTYEDLVPDRAAREAALAAFAARLGAHSGGGPLAPAPEIAVASDRDERDRAHLLLVRHHARVDGAFLSLEPEARGVVRDLVRDMAEGMCWSSATFAAQGGVLANESQLLSYCRHVLGNPVLFTVRLLRIDAGASSNLTPEEREDAMQVGEMVQLANVTRDVEKDLRRGIAYDPALAGDLGRDAAKDTALAERCRAARARMLRLALARAPSYSRMLDSMALPRWSIARASAVLMLLFTDRYFRACARRCGVPVWKGTGATVLLLPRALPATLSRAYTRRVVGRIERAFVAASRGT